MVVLKSMAKVHVAFFLFVSWVQWGSEAQDDWKRSSFPNEELTSGNEVAPSETRWGHYIKVNVKTSKREFSSTSGSVYITFYGKRATSGNILLQKGFSSGSLDSIRILLDREIGELERIKLQTNSTDGWLFASIWLDIGPRTYYMESSSIFLDYPDNNHADIRWDGDSRGSSFASDPVGNLNELYEPQAPHQGQNQVNEEGLLGKQSIMLNVDSYVDNYEDPYLEEGLEQWDP